MDTQQTQQFSAMMAGMMGVFLLVGLAVLAFILFLFWRIFSKAGLSGPLALLLLVPGIGSIIVLCILAFAEWKVVPVPQQYGTLPPNYPPPAPPPSFPSSGYPPQGPTT